MQASKGTRVVRSLWWIFFALACGELLARFAFGLGNPPLSQTHPTIEYMFKPNQSVHRFGNVFATNRYGMRSADFPPQKVSAKELRVMIYGDSVVNGGSQTDQLRLATSIVQKKLTEIRQIPVIVGNISAGSWGPPNELAYLQQFGFLDADLLILVLSSSDHDDAPTFEPLNPSTHPTVAPVSALWEGIQTYLPRYLPGRLSSGAPGVPDPNEIPNRRNVQVALGAEREFFRLAKAEGVAVALVQHMTATEVRLRRPLPGYWEIRGVAVESGVPVFEDGGSLQLAIASGNNPYRDDIHVNEAGQRVLSDLFLDVIQSHAPAHRADLHH